MFDFLLRPIKCHFGRDKVYYQMIDRLFGFIPNNIELYKLALIHKSASVDIGERQSLNNERLEFLGDAVIESVTSDYVYIEYPGYDEGPLTQLRSKIVSRQSLNEIARKIGLDRCVNYNRTGNFSQKNIFGDAFEAMMGAIYLDQGYDFVNRLLINKIYANHLSLEELDESETDFKSRLIEWCQKNHHQVHFRTRGSSNGTSAHFSSIVMIDNIAVGHGFGESKKEAEQDAARSVTHEVSDDDCTRLLDALDRMEMHEGKASDKGVKQTDAAESPEEQPRSRRRRSRRRRSGANAEQTAGNATAQAVEEVFVEHIAEPVAEVVAEAVVEEPVAVEPAAEVEKPKRSRRARKPKSEKAVEEATAESAAEQPVDESVAETPTAEEKPKRSRRGRKPKSEKSADETSAEQTAEAVAEMSSESAPETEKPKRSRRGRKPKAVAEGAVEAVTAEVASSDSAE